MRAISEQMVMTRTKQNKINAIPCRAPMLFCFASLLDGWRFANFLPCLELTFAYLLQSLENSDEKRDDKIDV